MPRFRDEWVIDRVLFDYVAGGSCACCGVAHFLPNGTQDWIAAISDLDTDQQQAEVAALNQNHPWPADLRDQVWADRVRLRQRLKRRTAEYRDFLETHKTAFEEWLRDPAKSTVIRRIVQLPRTEVMEIMREQYQIHSAYGVVLCAVVEQVANFPTTDYPTDAPLKMNNSDENDNSEVAFEQDLVLDRRMGLTLSGLLPPKDGSGNLCDVSIRKSLELLWRRLETLGGPKLLERGTSTSKARNEGKGNDSSDEEEVDGPVAAPEAQTSFLSDRRIIRLVIARYWADQLQSRFLQERRPQP